jgi:hypothetical protein
VEESRAKSPVAAMELKVNVATPELVTFTLFAPLNVPTV